MVAKTAIENVFKLVKKLRVHLCDFLTRSSVNKELLFSKLLVPNVFFCRFLHSSECHNDLSCPDVAQSEVNMTHAASATFPAGTPLQ